MKIQPQRTNRQSCLIVGFIIPLALCSCWCFFTILVDDVWGTINEFFLRYPNSELIWAGYGAYGSSDYGEKTYIRWTSDDMELVRQYYGDNRDVNIVKVTANTSQHLWVCTWAGFFAYKPGSGCEIVKRDTPNYGTLILYSHSYWAG